MSSEQLHEPADALRVHTIDHRAVTALVEELAAVDWYDQSVDAADDEELKGIRRRDPQLDAELRRYLFTTAPITDRAEEPEAPAGAPTASSLGIGSLRDKELL